MSFVGEAGVEPAFTSIPPPWAPAYSPLCEPSRLAAIRPCFKILINHIYLISPIESWGVAESNRLSSLMDGKLSVNPLQVACPYNLRFCPDSRRPCLMPPGGFQNQSNCIWYLLVRVSRRRAASLLTSPVFFHFLIK